MYKCFIKGKDQKDLDNNVAVMVRKGWKAKGDPVPAGSYPTDRKFVAQWMTR